MELVCMYGWHVFTDYNKRAVSEGEADFQAGKPHKERWEETDDRIANFCVHANADLRPFFHMWGEPPKDAVTGYKIANAGLHHRAGVKARLLHYRSIIPKTNEEYRAIMARHERTNMNSLPTWSSSKYDRVVKAIDQIIDLYLNTPETKSTCRSCGLAATKKGFEKPIPKQRIFYKHTYFTISNPNMKTQSDTAILNLNENNEIVIEVNKDIEYPDLGYDYFELFNPNKFLSLYYTSSTGDVLVKEYDITDKDVSFDDVRKITIKNLNLQGMPETEYKFVIRNSHIFANGELSYFIDKELLHPKIPNNLNSGVNVMRHIEWMGTKDDFDKGLWPEYDRYNHIYKLKSTSPNIAIDHKIMKLIDDKSFTITFM